MSIIREGNHERAWNDPPQFAYGTTEPRARTQLNKRVSYTPGIPTSPAPSAQVPVPTPVPIPTDNINVFTPPDFHPSSSSPPCGSPPTFAAKVDTSEVPSMPSTDMLNQVYSDLEFMVSLIQEKMSPRKLEDIRRHLNMMKAQWSEEKLSEPTKKLMYLLVTKLRACDYEEAGRMHVALIVNYSSEVSQWMVGVKRVILECQAQQVRP